MYNIKPTISKDEAVSNILACIGNLDRIGQQLSTKDYDCAIDIPTILREIDKQIKQSNLIEEEPEFQFGDFPEDEYNDLADAYEANAYSVDSKFKDTYDTVSGL